MRVVLSTTVQAHTFDFAKELQKRGELTALFSGYPKSKLATRGLAGPEIRSFPLPVLVGMAMNRLAKSQKFQLRSEPWPKILFDRYVAKHLPDCDLFVATSSVGLASGRQAKKRGAFWVCDRPCSHILTQNRLLTEEYELNGMKWPGIHPKIIERELAEYQEADAVLVASSFSEQSFVEEHGFPIGRLWKVPYGVDLSRFKPEGEPDPSRFDVLFVGQLTVRKGIRYLVEAFEKLAVKDKSLTLIGSVSQETSGLLHKAMSRSKIETLGVLPLEKVLKKMSQAHVLVLPSVEDGYGLVTAQALACGCPVVVSDHCGSADLVREELNGTVFPARSVKDIVRALELVATRRLNRVNVRETVRHVGGWDRFADQIRGLQTGLHCHKGLAVC